MDQVSNSVTSAAKYILDKELSKMDIASLSVETTTPELQQQAKLAQSNGWIAEIDNEYVV